MFGYNDCTIANSTSLNDVTSDTLISNTLKTYIAPITYEAIPNSMLISAEHNNNIIGDLVIDKIGDFTIELKNSYPEIKDVYVNNKYTTVKWEDDSVTTVKCEDEDEYVPETGLAMCYMKKMFGPGYYRKLTKYIKSAKTPKPRNKDKDKDKE